MRQRRFSLLFVMLFVASGIVCPARGQESSANNELAARAGAVLNNFCFRCHRGEGSSAGGYAFNARHVASMVDESMVAPEKLEDSDLYNAMFRGRMPPRNQAGLPRPSAEDIEVVKKWIEAGAPEFPPIPRREFMPLVEVMASMFEHYQKLEPNQRENYRYFTLANLWNDVNVDERQLRMTRAALAKALNSLSWEPSLVEPVAIDERKTTYAVDITQLGWNREHWGALVAEYPYHIEFEAILDGGDGEAAKQLRRIDQDMIRLSGNDRQIKFIRADWFITIGLRPKLYHKLLYELSLPELRARQDNADDPANPKSMTDRDLEKQLGVDVEKNIFVSPVKASRAAFSESGISGQNRMIERHPLSGQGYYWKSYDFLGSNSRAILTEFPLGPKRDAQDDFAFEHDGGEIIYTLPNGLQGYLLSDASGGRLDAGPIEIVGDALKTSGNQLIVNGLSCIVCHRQGMVEPPDDIVRGSAGVFGNLADQVRELYPESERMKKLVAADTAAFTSAVTRVLKPHLEEEDFKAVGDGFPTEPVGEVARWYLLQPMSLETVASELFHPNVDTLKVVIKNDPRARQIGIGQLKNDNGTIKREAWQNVEGRSLMQQAADVLGFSPMD
jgi:hypothetical protein